jgi:hypothetical protein
MFNFNGQNQGYRPQGQMSQSYGQMPQGQMSQSYGQNQGFGNQGSMNQGYGSMNQGSMNPMNQGLMNRNQGFGNQGAMNQNQGFGNQGAMPQSYGQNQGQMNNDNEKIGIPVSTYKQGFLNAIARWNVASGTSNAFQRMGNNSTSVEQIQATRDKRIRQALQEVLAMPNLGKYQALNAIGDATGNYLKYMVNGFSNKTRGGKRRRRGTRRNKK